MSIIAKKRALEAKLDARQRIAALLCVERELADSDTRKTFDEIADEVGVSRKALWDWRTQNKAFIEYANLLADDFLEAKQAVVYKRLMQLIDSAQPSVKAIDLYLRKHGKLTDRQVVETVTAGGGKSPEDIAKDIAELDDMLAEDDEGGGN